MPETGQVFRLEGTGEKKPAAEGRVIVSGAWKAEEGEEVVRLGEARP